MDDFVLFVSISMGKSGLEYLISLMGRSKCIESKSVIHVSDGINRFSHDMAHNNCVETQINFNALILMHLQM